MIIVLHFKALGIDEPVGGAAAAAAEGATASTGEGTPKVVCEDDVCKRT